VLEVGCGEGRVLRMLRGAGHETFGLDIDIRALGTASSRGSGPVVCGRAEALPFASETFGAVLAGFFAANLMDRDSMVGEAARVLRPGGVLGYTMLNPATRLIDLVLYDLRHGRGLRPARLSRAAARLADPGGEVARLLRNGLVPLPLRGPAFLPLLRRFRFAQEHAPVLSGPLRWLAWDVLVAARKPPSPGP